MFIADLSLTAFIPLKTFSSPRYLPFAFSSHGHAQKSSKDGGACSELLLNSVKTQVSGVPEVQFPETPLGGAVITILYFVCRSLSSLILTNLGNTYFVISVYQHHYQPNNISNLFFFKVFLMKVVTSLQ